jgi:ABC-type uncharacterized transport system ATPase subunit
LHSERGISRDASSICRARSDRSRRPSRSAIELRGIDKRFGPVHANQHIDLKVARQSIHGIVGENGAGKSTLMSILYGFYEADEGDIFVGGEKVSIRSSNDAIAHGIGMVHQHFMLVDNFTVIENVMLGAEGAALLRNGRAKVRADLKALSKDYGLTVDPDAVVSELSVGLQQRVEILKALYRGADILILDEPTGVLTPEEADGLFRILRQLRDQGKTILLITHKLREIMAVTDEVSVMRRGAMVATLTTAETSPAEIAEQMVGRRVLLEVEKGEPKPAEAALEVKEPHRARPLRRRPGEGCLLHRAQGRDRRHCRRVRQWPVGTARGDCRYPDAGFRFGGHCRARPYPIPATRPRRAGSALAMCPRTACAWAW